MIVARYPLCNNRPYTTLRIFGCALPLCARCCGGILGAIAGEITSFPAAMSAAGYAICLSLVALCAIDGLLSYGPIGSTNTRRVLSGAGVRAAG